VPRVSLETLIQSVVRELVAELKRQGVEIIDGPAGRDATVGPSPARRTECPDLSGYKTPVLTEAHVQRLSVLTGAVQVPRGTVVTPKAREILKAKRILLQFEP